MLNINVIAIPMPIITPLQDETIYGKSIVKEWNKFMHRYKPLWFGETTEEKEEEEASEPDPDPGEQAAKEVLTSI